MLGIVGIAVIFVMVFGGYILAGGKLAIIVKALPFELMMIGGAAIGAFLISNDIPSVKHTLKDIGKVFKGPKWKHNDYRDLLCLLFELVRLARSESGRYRGTYRSARGKRNLQPLPQNSDRQGSHQSDFRYDAIGLDEL